MTDGTTPRGMRRALTRYGDEGFSLFLREAFNKAMGFSDDALARPIVGIADTGSDYNACHASVPRLVEAVKRGVILAGRLPMAFPTISLHLDTVTQADRSCDFDFMSPPARSIPTTPRV